MNRLRDCVAVNGQPHRRGYFERRSLRRLLLVPVTRLLNLGRRRWFFRSNELRFILTAFEELVHRLLHDSAPSFELRMDLSMCQTIIERRLAGVPGLRAAAKVEHFCQADHVAHVKIEEIDAQTVGPSRRGTYLLRRNRAQ